MGEVTQFPDVALAKKSFLSLPLFFFFLFVFAVNTLCGGAVNSFFASQVAGVYPKSLVALPSVPVISSIKEPHKHNCDIICTYLAPQL